MTKNSKFTMEKLFQKTFQICISQHPNQTKPISISEVKEMQTKIILAFAAIAVVAAALVGVTYAQLVSNQVQNSTNIDTAPVTQLPNGQYVYGVPADINGTIIYPCGPYWYGEQAQQQAPAPAYGNGYGYGFGGMCGRFW
jgi:hypothetical protein